VPLYKPCFEQGLIKLFSGASGGRGAPVLKLRAPGGLFLCTVSIESLPGFLAITVTVHQVGEGNAAEKLLQLAAQVHPQMMGEAGLTLLAIAFLVAASGVD
jgi:hypothetical protein